MKFLSSFRFALVLIFFSAVGVIAGTIIEAKTDSHILAEDWIYRNPLFKLLLIGYFINILLSALSRYPFKKRHIPFLITHLGLLMLISGVFIKIQFGVQGNLQILEGTVSDDLIHRNIPALSVERKSPPGSQSIPLEKLDVAEYYPHAEEKYLFWQEAHPSFFAEHTDEKTILHTHTGDLTYPRNKLEEWIAYDRGFGGYTVQAEIAMLPPIELMKNAPEKILPYFSAWKDSGSWLFDQTFLDIHWEAIPNPTLRALYWIANIFDENNFLKTLEERQWPLIAPLKLLKEKEDQYLLWMNQIYSIQDHLPPVPESLSSVIQARMLTAYLRLFPIRLPKNTVVESHLSHEILPKDPPLKKEDAKPAIVIAFGAEKIPLVYDPDKTGLKWPSSDRNHLLRFQPHREKLPYLVRLHHASDIKHPGSEQTASYECTLSLTDKRTGVITPCALQMNHVHETPDGYRFYLSGMGKVDRFNVRTVQLVVNHDPAKMFLTYPGGLLIALGTLLLFFRKAKD